ncbi:MAG: YfhO family protein [Bacteroidales bacterium]|nr:YfhO family protein [Bacteroidales bacterium]
MKNNFFQKNKKTLGIVLAIVAFAVITLVYFSPIFEGKRLQQHDISMYKGMSKEIADYREATGEATLWTNSMFGGMPAWNISARQNSNLFNEIHPVLSLGLPSPIGAVFIAMLGFFILLLVLDCSVWLSFVGALAYGFTSYMFIIIGAGHNTKAFAIAYMAPVIAGVLLAYKGKYLWGAVLTAFALALEVKANHLQITYYLLLILIILIVAEFISDIKAKKLGHFFKASAVLLLAAVFGIMTNFTILYANYDFGKETTRGKPVLVNNESNQTKGLDRDYITQWSYGKGETWSLLIPNVKGGATGRISDMNYTLDRASQWIRNIGQGNSKSRVVKKNPALDKADRQFRDNVAQSNAYWGDQPGTSGPVYVGAIVVFLFIFGALTVKGKLKWALLIATLLSILLSWGKNFMGLTDFFIDYIPGYNKFRAVSMTLVIAEVTMPLLGFLGLAELVKSPENAKKNMTKFFIALGITAGFCLLFYLLPKTFFNFLSQEEAKQFAAMSSGKDGAIYAQFASQLENVRVAIFRKDAMRSLVLIILAAIPLFLYAKGKLKTAPAFAILAALIIVDMFSIDKRYLNNDNFVDKTKADKPYTATAADQYILNDKALDFRVADITKDMFNDASTSYFHKSIGGYSGAKLRRYQDVISQYLGPELNQLRTAKTMQDMMALLEQQDVLNMLNTKYIIFNPQSQPFENPFAYGNAWMANNVQVAETPNDEFNALATTDMHQTAVIGKEFEQQVSGYKANTEEGSITLMDYQPNQLTYSFSASENKLVVFSEIWTSKGWTMQIDGQESPLLRANYLLRAAMIPAGQHEIVMRYEPRIWKVGGMISLVSSLIIILGLIGAIVFTLKKQNAPVKA